MESQTLIEKIIDNARWAPSGDNMQTWRFEIINDQHFVVHGYDTREHCVYDLQGHASQLAIGALLESINISASAFQYLTEFKLRSDLPETKPTIDVFLSYDSSVMSDPLLPFLPIRSVQRRMMKSTQLTVEQKMALEQAVGNFYSIKWIEGFANRCRAAWLMQQNGKLRLTLPEAFSTHSTVIEWNARFSDDKIPDQAVGLDPLATKSMKWAMQSWKRVSFLNSYCFGTLLPRIELDLLPGLFCAAHFAIVAERKPESVEDYLNVGRAVQRFWLTATQLGMQLQPEMTPLIFFGYVKEKVLFSRNVQLTDYTEKLSNVFELLIGKSIIYRAVFVGRIGQGDIAKARSLRHSVRKLISFDDINN